MTHPATISDFRFGGLPAGSGARQGWRAATSHQRSAAGPQALVAPTVHPSPVPFLPPPPCHAPLGAPRHPCPPSPHARARHSQTRTSQLPNARERTCVPKRSPCVRKRFQAGKILRANACARHRRRTPTHVRRHASPMRRNASPSWKFLPHDACPGTPRRSPLETRNSTPTAHHRTCGAMR